MKTKTIKPKEQSVNKSRIVISDCKCGAHYEWWQRGDNHVCGQCGGRI
jgi:predicted SprT family Zn-dependent metalloprotease